MVFLDPTVDMQVTMKQPCICGSGKNLSNAVHNSYNFILKYAHRLVEGKGNVTHRYLYYCDYCRSHDWCIVCWATEYGLVRCCTNCLCDLWGSVRDVLLGHYPLTWVKHPEYLVLTCCAAFVTIVIAKWMRHLHNIFWCSMLYT